MTEPTGQTPDPALPRPIVKKMRWPFPIIWIVPLAAAALAGYYLYERHKERGLEITIEFPDAAGIKPGQTPVSVHGVPIGKVATVELSGDEQHATAHIRLEQAYDSVARQGTVFWLVRPQVSLQNFSLNGLNTIVSGPYIEAKPGQGPPVKTFDGLLEAPKSVQPGTEIVLFAERIGQLTQNSPVTYRGIQVGVVQDVQLRNDAEAAEVRCYIWQRYTTLIRLNSQFWMVKGADIQGSLLGGVQLKLNSPSELFTGGVAFATPTQPGKNIAPGAEFFLTEQANPEWLKWKPRIPLPAEVSAQGKEAGNGSQGPSLLPTLKQE